jgi:hypothetical protein
MAYQLSFEKLVNYDVGEPGIGLAVELRSNERAVNLTAKVDTGATYCIFERRYAEQLGLDVELGMRQVFGTATGQFLAYGHDVTLSVSGFDFDSLVFFPADEQISRNVPGRVGWLDRMMIGLVDYEGKLYLSVYDDH